MRYSTKNEFIANEITAALGASAEDFDIDAIADEVCVQRSNEDADGVTIGNVWYEQAEDVDFWEVVAKHDKS